MSNETNGLRGGHPIQVVSRKTGLSQHVIRAWERRYEAVNPDRTETGRRLYREEDVERLLLIQGALRGGRRIGDVAGLTRTELEALIRGDRPAQSSPTAPRSELVEEGIQAIRNLDADRLVRRIKMAAAKDGIQSVLESGIGPLMREVGHLWSRGELDPYHEHFASSAVKRVLQESMASVPVAPVAPVIVVATPAGQYHEIGALIAAVHAALQGWRVVYLGVDLPARDIATAALRSARVIALSLVYPPDDQVLYRELEQLGSALGGKIPVLAGGAAAVSYGEVLDAIGAKRLSGLESMTARLTALAGEGEV